VSEETTTHVITVVVQAGQKRNKVELLISVVMSPFCWQLERLATGEQR